MSNTWGLGVVLAQPTLFANLKKCDFWKREVAYLGHVISSNGVVVDMDKVKAMLEWVEPKNLRELRGLLGLMGYYHKIHCELCSHCAAPH